MGFTINFADGNLITAAMLYKQDGFYLRVKIT